MRFAYLTLDEVHEDLALELAATCGVTLCPLAPKDGPPDGRFDAVLIDWDSWPCQRRQEALTELLSRPTPCPVAVHGYNLEDGQVKSLCHQGVAIYGSLRPEMFRRLRRLVLARRAAEATGGGADDSQVLDRTGGAA